MKKIETGNAAPSMEALILLSERFHKTVDWTLKDGVGN
jgi:hypothetical protein